MLSKPLRAWKFCMLGKHCACLLIISIERQQGNNLEWTGCEKAFKLFMGIRRIGFFMNKSGFWLHVMLHLSSSWQFQHLVKRTLLSKGASRRGHFHFTRNAFWLILSWYASKAYLCRHDFLLEPADRKCAAYASYQFLADNLLLQIAKHGSMLWLFV